MKTLEEIKKIHVVPYSHHDHAWTNSRQWHIWRYIEGFCLALDLMNTDLEYTLTIDNVLHSLIVFEQYCPARADEFKRRVREGRISVANGGMALARPADFDGELLIRNGVAGRRVFEEKFGLDDIPVYFNADTAIGFSQMPQILKNMGHNYYRFSRPHASMDLMGVPGEFIWRGLDGSRIIASRSLYGGCVIADWANLDTWSEKKASFINEDIADKLGRASTDRILLNVGLDDSLPNKNIYDHDIDLSGFIADWNANESSQMVYSSFDKYFEEISRQELPVWEGPVDEAELAFNAPVRVDKSLRRMRIIAERLLLINERLGVIMQSMGLDSGKDTIDMLWDRLFAFSGHAMQHLLERDYDEILAFAEATIVLLGEERTRRTDAIAQQAARLSKVSHVVINTNGFELSEPVELHITSPYHVNGLVLRDSSGKILPWQITEMFNGDKGYKNKQFNEVRVAVPITVPAMGYESVSVQFDGKPMQIPENAADISNFVINNGVFTAAVENGVVVMLAYPDGKKLAQSEICQLRFYHTEPTDTWLYNWEPKSIEIMRTSNVLYIEYGPLRYRFITEGTIGLSPVRLETIITRDSPVIKYNLTLDNRESEGYYMISLPCAKEPMIKASIPFGEENREVEKILYAYPNRGENMECFWERNLTYGFYANGYVRYICGEGNMALLQGDLNSFCRSEPGKGEIEQLLYRSVDMSARTEQWVTKIGKDFSGTGEQHFEYAVAVLDKDDGAAQAARMLHMQRAPLITSVRYQMNETIYPPALSCLKINNYNVMLSAAYIKDEALIARVYECDGLMTSCSVKTVKQVQKAQVIDFTGKPLEKQIKIGDGIINFDMGAWEIATLKISF
ncbi:MAG: hypothetical protein FWD23_08815 [Oscillospiraceae bacterium]|nr:hypothetical protein [Oscillospiraceae bacterium]